METKEADRYLEQLETAYSNEDTLKGNVSARVPLVVGQYAAIIDKSLGLGALPDLSLKPTGPDAVSATDSPQPDTQDAVSGRDQQDAVSGQPTHDDQAFVDVYGSALHGSLQRYVHQHLWESVPAQTPERLLNPVLAPTTAPTSDNPARQAYEHIAGYQQYYSQLTEEVEAGLDRLQACDRLCRSVLDEGEDARLRCQQLSQRQSQLEQQTRRLETYLSMFSVRDRATARLSKSLRSPNAGRFSGGNRFGAYEYLYDIEALSEARRPRAGTAAPAGPGPRGGKDAGDGLIVEAGGGDGSVETVGESSPSSLSRVPLAPNTVTEFVHTLQSLCDAYVVIGHVHHAQCGSDSGKEAKAGVKERDKYLAQLKGVTKRVLVSLGEHFEKALHAGLRQINATVAKSSKKAAASTTTPSSTSKTTPRSSTAEKAAIGLDSLSSYCVHSYVELLSLSGRIAQLLRFISLAGESRESGGGQFSRTAYAPNTTQGTDFHDFPSFVLHCIRKNWGLDKSDPVFSSTGSSRQPSLRKGTRIPELFWQLQRVILSSGYKVLLEAYTRIRGAEVAAWMGRWLEWLVTQWEMDRARCPNYAENTQSAQDTASEPPTTPPSSQTSDAGEGKSDGDASASPPTCPRLSLMAGVASPCKHSLAGLFQVAMRHVLPLLTMECQFFAQFFPLAANGDTSSRDPQDTLLCLRQQNDFITRLLDPVFLPLRKALDGVQRVEECVDLLAALHGDTLRQQLSLLAPGAAGAVRQLLDRLRDHARTRLTQSLLPNLYQQVLRAWPSHIGPAEPGHNPVRPWLLGGTPRKPSSDASFPFRLLGGAGMLRAAAIPTSSPERKDLPLSRRLTALTRSVALGPGARRVLSRAVRQGWRVADLCLLDMEAEWAVAGSKQVAAGCGCSLCAAHDAVYAGPQLGSGQSAVSWRGWPRQALAVTKTTADSAQTQTTNSAGNAENKDGGGGQGGAHGGGDGTPDTQERSTPALALDPSAPCQRWRHALFTRYICQLASGLRLALPPARVGRELGSVLPDVMRKVVWMADRAGFAVSPFQGPSPVLRWGVAGEKQGAWSMPARLPVCPLAELPVQWVVGVPPIFHRALFVVAQLLQVRKALLHSCRDVTVEMYGPDSAPSPSAEQSAGESTGSPQGSPAHPSQSSQTGGTEQPPTTSGPDSSSTDGGESKETSGGGGWTSLFSRLVRFGRGSDTPPEPASQTDPHSAPECTDMQRLLTTPSDNPRVWLDRATKAYCGFVVQRASYVPTDIFNKGRSLDTLDDDAKRLLLSESKDQRQDGVKGTHDGDTQDTASSAESGMNVDLDVRVFLLVRHAQRVLRAVSRGEVCQDQVQVSHGHLHMTGGEKTPVFLPSWWAPDSQLSVPAMLLLQAPYEVSVALQAASVPSAPGVLRSMLALLCGWLRPAVSAATLLDMAVDQPDCLPSWVPLLWMQHTGLLRAVHLYLRDRSDCWALLHPIRAVTRRVWGTLSDTVLLPVQRTLMAPLGVEVTAVMTPDGWKGEVQPDRWFRRGWARCQQPFDEVKREDVELLGGLWGACRQVWDSLDLLDIAVRL